MTTKMVAGRQVPIVGLSGGLSLEDHTEFASPAIRMWLENWTVVLDGKTIGLVRRQQDGWESHAYCGTWKRPDGWPLRSFLQGDHKSQEDAARMVESYWKFGEADGWRPGFGSRFAELQPTSSTPPAR